MFLLEVVGSLEPALVDDCWAHLIKYRWSLHKGYVVRKSHGHRIMLHHVVIDICPIDHVRDHININTLDNRAVNLRFLHKSYSSQNRKASPKNLTDIRGLAFFANTGRYLAKVQSNGKVVFKQWFANPSLADTALRRARAIHTPYSSI